MYALFFRLCVFYAYMYVSCFKIIRNIIYSLKKCKLSNVKYKISIIKI